MLPLKDSEAAAAIVRVGNVATVTLNYIELMNSRSLMAPRVESHPENLFRKDGKRKIT